MFKREDLIRPCPNCETMTRAHHAVVSPGWDIYVYLFCENCHRGWTHTMKSEVKIVVLKDFSTRGC